MNNSKMKIVYVITKNNGRSFWNRIGVAFVNRDGSINVKLEAVPVSGEMQIRDYVPCADEEGADPALKNKEDETVPGSNLAKGIRHLLARSGLNEAYLRWQMSLLLAQYDLESIRALPENEGPLHDSG